MVSAACALLAESDCVRHTLIGVPSEIVIVLEGEDVEFAADKGVCAVVTALASIHVNAGKVSCRITRSPSSVSQDRTSISLE